MEIHVLGPVGLVFQEGRLGLGSDKQRLIMASLALEVGRPIALDTLVDRLWENPPPRAREGVHTYISRIRRAIRTAASAEPRLPVPSIAHRTHTYTLVAEPDTVDWHRYRRLAERAGAVSAGGDDVRGAELMREAEGLWEEPLAGLPGLWPERVRTSLAEKRRGVVTMRIAMELRLGRFAEMAGELSSLVDQYPGDEALAGQLMIAHYGSGRHAEALLLYQRVRRILRSDFGTDPGEELVRIHRHILGRAPVRELTGQTVPTTKPRADVSQVPGHLPRQAALVGRRDEIGRIRAAMDTASENGSVVTLESISGMAGVGKSALAIRAAHEFGDRFPDHHLYLNLRAHSPGQDPLEPGAALATLLRMLEVPPQSIPADVDERAALWRKALGHRRALIILDDAAGPEQVRPLLPGASACFTLITSRRRLVGLASGRSLALDVLPADDAAELFREFAGLERAGDTKDTQDLSRADDAVEITEIVRLCGYLPLAIEIAANRLTAHPSWNLAVLRERLSRSDGRLAEIRDGYSEITRAFEVSYQTLTSAERATFRLLSLHVGPEFGLSAAATLLGRPVAETERLLESLLQCHLLLEPVPNRFQFHDLLGEYAQLLCAGQDPEERREAARLRLVGHYLRTADHCDRLLHPRRIRLDLPNALAAGPGPTPPDSAGPVRLHAPADASEALAWLVTERVNLLSTEEHLRTHGPHAQAALLSHVLAGFLDSECYWTDSVRLHGAAVEFWRRSGHEAGLCRALLDLSTAHMATGQYAQAERTADDALRLARVVHDRDAEAEALRELGILHWHMGQNQRALELQKESLALCARAGDQWRQARCQNNIAICLLYLGEHDIALSYFQDAITGFRAADDQRMLAKTLNNLGTLYLHMGNPKLARRTLESSLQIAERTGNRSDKATLQINLAEILASSGDSHTALTMYRAALPVFRELGDRKNEAITLTRLGHVYQDASETEHAVTHLQQALTLSRSIGAALEEIQAERLLGRCEFTLGHLDAAVRHLESARDSARRIHVPEEEGLAEECLAELRLHRSNSNPADRR
ncbi:AfsR/SARP family transcriptional regulator [Streptomyces sp. NBC_00878]|uniref:AfsR/SARP family transcriptional regulator n=1 Tax=Streptomyces sp. NBC_00878 TaxID=2975854 RepID=UPI00225A98C2|nr:AfsR/SARP family transcriptional regulator [Streptomyces sp. NBC_00878]MCX4903898.1 tetratricopeptide repeat protein [Streptomyces sp. NBC_00878]